MKNCNHKTDKIGHFFDNLMWYVIYLLPVVLMIIFWCRGNTGTLSDVMTASGLSIITDNVLFTALSTLFGTGGYLPIFTDTSFLLYASYFILVFVVHLTVDILLFVFRCMHRIVNHGFGGASHE